MKSNCNFSLTHEAQRDLDALTQAYNLERSGIVEALVRGAAESVSKRLRPLIKSRAQGGYTLSDLLWPDGDVNPDAAIAVARSLMPSDDPTPTLKRIPPAQATGRLAALFEVQDRANQGLSKAFFGEPQPEPKEKPLQHVARRMGFDDE